MNGAIPNQQQYPPQPMEIQAPIASPQSKQNKLGIAILFIVFFLILLAVILNYFNILPLSNIFPNQLGFLPRKEVPTGTSQFNNVTIAPPPISSTDQAKQTLVNFLAPILDPSLLVPPSDITLTQEKGSSERFIAQWTTKDGVVGVSFTTSEDLKKIVLLDFGLNKVETSSWSEELGKATIPQVFSIKPKGQWGCKVALAKRLYCENFWEEQGSKRGLGFLIIPTNISSRIVFSFCEHSKGSNIYSWKSCRAEFAKSGVQ